MMYYEFICDRCGGQLQLEGESFKPPKAPMCDSFDALTPNHKPKRMRRLFGAQIDTSGCKDHSYIPPQHRVHDPHRRVSAEKQERIFHERIQEKRRAHRDGGNKGLFQHSHSIPADLHHGKIKETGDKHYWEDKKNMDRHSDCRVDK